MNLKMVRIDETHAQKRWEALSDPDISKWLLIELPVSYVKTKEWCSTVANRPNRVDFCFQIDGEHAPFAGIVNIDHKNGLGEIYIFVHPEFLGRGVGEKMLSRLLAFGKFELNLRKIYLYVTSDNKRAISFYEKKGFFVEGVLKKHIWFRGGYRDRVIMSIFTSNLELDPDKFYGESL